MKIENWGVSHHFCPDCERRSGLEAGAAADGLPAGGNGFEQRKRDAEQESANRQSEFCAALLNNIDS